ncbi:MAG TPA: histidinol dehydrogenase, partial [Thermaerobacter sp.]
VDRVFRVGGAQAIAALAFGTESVPAVDKIVGPGNAFVTAAKALVASRVGIDALAGPSEIVIVADAGADPAWVAADLLAQAEHDPLAVAGCLSDSPALLEAVAAELDRQLEAAPRAGIAAAALERGFLVATRDVAEAVELANRIAPEHLSLHLRDAETWLARVRAAGAVFAGPFSPVAAGDYAAGTNHILPTGGAARHQSGVSPETFVRRIPFFAGTREGTGAWAGAALLLAEAEGLPAHAASIRARQAAGEATGQRGDRPDGKDGAGRAAGESSAWRPAGTPAATAVRPRAAVPAPAAAGPAPAGGTSPGYTVADSDAPIKLDANESSEPWPQELLAELRAELERADLHRYPRHRLREEVTGLLADYTGLPAACIVLGNGSDELVQAVLGVLGRHCAAVVAPAPTFGYYAVAAEAAGLPYHPVPVPPDRPWTPAALLAALDRIPGDKIVFLCRPNNPTGLSCDRELVRRLLARPDAWLVVDEAYAEFAGESVLQPDPAAGVHSPGACAGAAAPGAAAGAGSGGLPAGAASTAALAGAAAGGGTPAAPGRLPGRLVVLRTMSKAFALAGCRVGYAVAAPELAERLRRWLQPYNLGTFPLLAARAALRRRDVFLRRVEAIRRRRDDLARALAALPGIEPLPSRANFILFRVDPRPGDSIPRAVRVRDRLREEGIAVRHFPWEPALRDYLRVTVGTEAENAAFLEALGRALEAPEGGNGR